MQKVSEQITNLRKAQNKRENDRKELADVVEQEKLIEIKGACAKCGGDAVTDVFALGRRPHKLIDVHIRPALDAKRIAPGEVELHANGLRYYAQNGNKVGESVVQFLRAFLTTRLQTFCSATSSISSSSHATMNSTPLFTSTSKPQSC